MEQLCRQEADWRDQGTKVWHGRTVLGYAEIDCVRDPRCRFPVSTLVARAQSAFEGSAGPSRGVFVGRTRELTVLREALAGAQNRVGRIILLAGEPGVGKTRLSEEFGRGAGEGGVEVLAGRC